MSKGITHERVTAAVFATISEGDNQTAGEMQAARTRPTKKWRKWNALPKAGWQLRRLQR
jgi:hypothetical protein